MNLLLLTVVVIFAPFYSVAEANIEACSPSNTNIEIDARIPGVISTPAFPDGYPSSTCTWKIQAPDSLRLTITIEVLRLGGQDDHLVIRDGATPFTPLIGKYGPCASGSVTLFSSGSSAFLQTVSAVFSLNNDLRITYRPTDSDDIDCSSQAENPPNFCSINTYLMLTQKEPYGVLSSPKFPNNYDAGQSCLWTIIAPQGYRVQFTIQWLGIEDHRYSRPGSCGDDKLSISEDRGNSTGNVATLCGCKPLITHVSYNEKMWLKFSSYKKANWPGFYVTFQALAPEECPAGDNNCPIKSMAPVGFNAQGQVCTVRVKSSTKVVTSSTTSLLPSSVNSLAKTSTQALKASTQAAKPTNALNSSAIKTEIHALETRTSVLPPFLETSYTRSSVKKSVVLLDKSTPVTLHSESSSLLASSVKSSANESSQALEKSALMASPSGPFSVGSLVKTSNQAQITSTSNTMLSKNTEDKTAESGRSVTSSFSKGKTTSVKVSTIKQIHTQVIVPSSIVTSTFTVRGEEYVNTTSLSVLYSSEVELHVSSKPTKVSESSTGQTKILDQATSSLKLEQSTKEISEASFIQAKDTETIDPGAQLKHSLSVGSNELKVSSLIGHKTENVKPFLSTKTLVTKATVWETSSMTRPDHVISDSGHVTPVSQSKIIQPSKASEKVSEGISSVTQTATKQPPVVTKEPHHNDTVVQVIEGKDSPPKGLTVKCTHYAMEVTISKILQPYLDISSLHLQDPECKVTFSNDTHALMRAPLESCDTEQRTTEDYFIYLNHMMGDTKSKSSLVITRKGKINVEFSCLYRRIHVLSIISYSPRTKIVRTDGEGFGNFSFEMDMFQDPKYDLVVKQYPVIVHPGQTMYFQVDVKSRDGNLLAFLEECWVTPTTNSRDQTRHTIIEHGCSRDSTLQYVHEKSATQKFTFQAFQFHHVPSSLLYVHCEVVTCRRADVGSVCDTGCAENRRRRRENKPYIMDKDVFLSVGPVNFEEKSAAKSSTTRIRYIQVLTGVLAVLALVLLTAIVIVILRRRKRDIKNAWILLASKGQRIQDEQETDTKLMQTEL